MISVVISHVGDNYLEKFQGPTRWGGYAPATYQWVGFLLSKVLLYYII